MASSPFLNELQRSLTNPFLFFPVCLFSLLFWSYVARGAFLLLRLHLRRVWRLLQRKCREFF